MTIDLNLTEVLLVLDRLKYEECGPELILRMAGLFLELTDAARPTLGEISMALSEQEAWSLRKVTFVTDVSPNGERTGLGLLRKIYRVLTDLANDADGSALTPEWEMEQRAQLKKFLEGTNAGDDTAADNANDSPNGEAGARA